MSTISDQPKAESEVKPKNKFDFIEVALKVFQIIAICLGFFAVQSYVDQGKIKFYEKQLEFYINAAKITATLATEDSSSDDFKKAKKEFYQLYWGELSMFETREVESSMVTFDYLLRNYETGTYDTNTMFYLNKLPAANPSIVNAKNSKCITKEVLQQASLYLAHNTRYHTLNYFLSPKERKDYN